MDDVKVVAVLEILRRTIVTFIAQDIIFQASSDADIVKRLRGAWFDGCCPIWPAVNENDKAHVNILYKGNNCLY